MTVYNFLKESESYVFTKLKELRVLSFNLIIQTHIIFAKMHKIENENLLCICVKNKVKISYRWSREQKILSVKIFYKNCWCMYSFPVVI